MNSDPAAEHGEGEIVLYLCLISQQTFQTAPVLAPELFYWEWQRRGRSTVRNMWGDLRRRWNKCYQNSPGILDGAFLWGGLFNEMWPWGESHHRHSQTCFHLFRSAQTFQWNVLCCMAIGGWLRVNQPPTKEQRSRFFRWLNYFHKNFCSWRFKPFPAVESQTL